MNDIDLGAIESRIIASTPAPWQKAWEHDHDEDGYAVTGGAEPGTMHEHLVAYTLDWPASEEQAAADAEFIAHAREDVPALVAEVRRLRDEVQTARVMTLETAYWRVHPHRFAGPGHTSPPGVADSTVDSFFAGILRAKAVLADMQAEEANS